MEQFNLFRHLVFSEDGHSSLLKKLLHVKGKHNLNNFFIKSLVEEVLKCPFSQQLLVETNLQAGEKGYVDILIYNEDKTVIYIIENKIKGAKDRPNQLYRYWRNHIKTQEENEIKGDYKIFYLTKNGDNPSPESLSIPIVSSKTSKYKEMPDKLPIEVIPISYKKDIKNWLKNCLNQIERTEENLRLIITLEQYVEWIESKYC